MKRKSIAGMLAAAALGAALLAGCALSGGKAPAETNPANGEAAAEAEEAYRDTGDASLDDPRNQDGIGEQELLVVSFGTSYNDSRRLAIGAVEAAMEEAFPDYSVRRAFTSQIIIDRVKSRDGIEIDNVEEALERAANNGVRTLVIQPTHLMDGLEYTDLVNEAAGYADAFEKIAVGEPLLSSDGDFAAVAQAIAEDTAQYDDGETAICFMGHGTEADSNGVYGKLQRTLSDAGYENYYVGTVEASPTLEEVLAAVQEKGYRRVVLQPLMVVAGDHANNDMAGEEDSWKTAFEDAGYEVVCVMKGLGEMPAIQQLFVEHARNAAGSEGEEASAQAGGEGEEAAVQTGGEGEEASAQAGGLVASAEEMGTVEDVVEEGMEPIYGDSLTDGVYSVTVDSSSAMFRITACELTVQEGQMTARMTMGGTGYLYVFMGTGKEAALVSEEDYIPFEEDEAGTHSFTVPVEALDKGIACAAFSRNKEKWYDRTILFRADSLPLEAFREGTATEWESLGLEDGEYLVDVRLEGGSGRASVDSPAKLSVQDGLASATIVFGSGNYDYMKVEDVRYDAELTGGRSAFTIPVAYFDWKMPVIANTIAMSTPHEIAYTLSFDAASIVPAEQ